MGVGGEEYGCDGQDVVDALNQVFGVSTTAAGYVKARDHRIFLNVKTGRGLRRAYRKVMPIAGKWETYVHLLSKSDAVAIANARNDALNAGKLMITSTYLSASPSDTVRITHDKDGNVLISSPYECATC